MAVIQGLSHLPVDVSFYNIDLHRPSEGAIREYFDRMQFDIVGISSVVSTAYQYTKWLAALVREVSPASIIVLGGNLAASAEIVLRFTEVDICVIGDGEEIFAQLVAEVHRGNRDFVATGLRGLGILVEGDFVFTGYQSAPEPDQLTMPNYELLELDGSIDHYLPLQPWWFEFDGFKKPYGMEDLRSATVISTKGCVARCTFCHRFEKGYRAIAPDKVIEHLDELKTTYNVGFLTIGDENFGSNKEVTRHVVEALGSRGFLWRAAGVRARTVDLEGLKFWRENGCLEVVYGVESGSQKMLDVMQKNTTVEMNSAGLKAARDAGLLTALQLVIGMPGEDEATIRETTDFAVKHLDCLLTNAGMPVLSINYAQALPGTPLYEYARQVGLIGRSLEEEERYLIGVSDVNASDVSHYLNFTGLPLLQVMTWRVRMVGEVYAHFVRNYLNVRLGMWRTLQSVVAATMNPVLRRLPALRTLELNSPLQLAVNAKIESTFPSSQGYFNLGDSRTRQLLLFYPGIRKFSYPIVCLIQARRNSSRVVDAWKLIWDHLSWSVTKRLQPRGLVVNQSLRKLVAEGGGPVQGDSSSEMELLRLGR